MKKRSKLWSAVLAASIVVGLVASNASVVKAAGKELNVSSLEEATYNEEVVAGDFTYVATADKSITITTHEEPVVAEDGKEFTKVMSFGGGANQIKFKASKGEKIVVYVLSTGSDAREVGLYSATEVDEAGKNMLLAKNPIPGKESPIGAATFEAPADGEYFIATVTKGMRVYYLSVGDVATKQDSSVPKTGVVSVAAICGVVALASAGVAVVTGKKED